MAATPSISATAAATTTRRGFDHVDTWIFGKK